jgi:hypothetical protein
MANKNYLMPKEISDHVFSEITLWLLDNRPPEEIRPQLDIGWRIERQSVFIYEIRPAWNNPSEIRHYDFAKATYVKMGNYWKVYWLRQDMKWHPL